MIEDHQDRLDDPHASAAHLRPAGEDDAETTRPPVAVAILGTGLIGGSLGMALRRAASHWSVTGWDRSPDALRLAEQRGAIDQVAHHAIEAVEGADLVVLAVPVGATVPVLLEIAPYLAPGATVTDVGSTKARIVRECQALVGERFVGGHPMAGSERPGIDAAEPGLFTNARWVLTPTAQTDPRAVARVERLVRAAGAIPRHCDPVRHDQLIAALSHLPHVLAYGLSQTAGRLVDEPWLDLGAGSFRDGTRVSDSPPDFWAEILMDNRDAVLKSLDCFLAWAQEVRTLLETGDDPGLHRALEAGHAARKRFRA